MIASIYEDFVKSRCQKQALLFGMSKAIDIGNIFRIPTPASEDTNADYNNIAAVWRQVGQDLYIVMENYE